MTNISPAVAERLFREPTAHDLARVPERPRALLIQAQARGVSIRTNGSVWKFRGPRADITILSADLPALKAEDLFTSPWSYDGEWAPSRPPRRR